MQEERTSRDAGELTQHQGGMPRFPEVGGMDGGGSSIDPGFYDRTLAYHPRIW
jgi:hypothetical protein